MLFVYLYFLLRDLLDFKYRKCIEVLDSKYMPGVNAFYPIIMWKMFPPYVCQHTQFLGRSSVVCYFSACMAFWHSLDIIVYANAFYSFRLNIANT